MSSLDETKYNTETEDEVGKEYSQDELDGEEMYETNCQVKKMEADTKYNIVLP